VRFGVSMASVIKSRCFRATGSPSRWAMQMSWRLIAAAVHALLETIATVGHSGFDGSVGLLSNGQNQDAIFDGGDFSGPHR
jgi:hypothetical protein